MTEQYKQSGQTVGDHFATYDFAESDLIIVPGTGDRDAATLKTWADFIVRRFPAERQTVVDYPATVWPLVGGWRGERYDKSKEKAAAGTREALRNTGRAVLLAYSQGAEGGWEGAVEAITAGEIAPEDLQVILWGHPQRPGGLKDVLSRKHRMTSRLFGTALIGANMNGAWDIQAHPDIAVTSLAIDGDPITSFPSVWPNPVRFARSFAAGYFEIHGGAGHESAKNVAERSARVTHVLGTRAVMLDAAAMDPIEQRRIRLQDKQELSLMPEALSA